MEKRTRPNQLKIRLSDKELAQVRQKMDNLGQNQCGISSSSASLKHRFMKSICNHLESYNISFPRPPLMSTKLPRRSILTQLFIQKILRQFKMRFDF